MKFDTELDYILEKAIGYLLSQEKGLKGLK